MASLRTKPGGKGLSGSRARNVRLGPRQPRRAAASTGDPWPAGAEGSYLRLSARPLHVMVFLLPLILFYEIAAALHIIGAQGVEETIRARRVLGDFFAVFGVGGLYLPGILVTVVLILWHILTRDPWRVRPRVVWMMGLESLVWTPPVLVLGQVLYKLLSGSLGAQPPITAGLEVLASAEAFADRPLMARMAIAVGAGLYEEMLFRMVGIALFHLILVDLIGLGSRKGTVLSVVFASIAFAAYHDVGAGAGGGVRWADAAFYVFAGLYFGLVYVWRGFGVVVGVHVLYDLAVLVFFSPKPPGVTSG